jgi:hypothetical protein
MLLRELKKIKSNWEKGEMGSRGRVSSAELAIIGPIGIETIRRPEAPDELTEEQAHEWRAVVNRLSPDWFPRETHPLLVQHCRLVIRARRLSQLVDAAEEDDEFDPAEYRALVRAEQNVTRALATLAVKMRLSQSTTMRPETIKKPNALRKPWEPD